MRLSFLCISTALLSGCAANGILTATSNQEAAVAFSQFVEVIPAPAFIVRTRQPSTLTVLLTAECRVGAPGQILEAQITIDGQPLEPPIAVMTTLDRYETRSQLAVKADTPAGLHKVTVQWRIRRGTAFIRRRSLTVWQSGRGIE